MLVISAKSGQLGNRLLLFANFIAFATEHKFKVINPAFEEYADFFQSTSQDLFCSYPVPKIKLRGNKFARSKYYILNRYLAEHDNKFNKIKITREKPFNWSDSSLVNQIKHNNINFFEGWLFRDGWFVKDIQKLQQHGDLIRAYFIPLKIYQTNVSKLIAKIRNNSDIVIGVHIRHGDYQQHQGGRYYFTVQEYIKVMHSIKTLFPNKKVTFLICSNEAHDPNLFQEFDYIYGNNHIIEDMYSLAECNYIIGPPSTYTMWASFYGNKPLYMIRDINKNPELKDFVYFYQWQGNFYAQDDWSKSFWEWTH